MLSVPKRANDAMHLSMLDGGYKHTHIHTHTYLSHTQFLSVHYKLTHLCQYILDKSHLAAVSHLWVRNTQWHLKMYCIYCLGFDGNIDSQGELILQESFQVWDPKTLIRKGRDRHLFLFEMSLVFSKEVKDSNGRSKYLYKSKLFVSSLLFLCRESLWNQMFLSASANDKRNIRDQLYVYVISLILSQQIPCFQTSTSISVFFVYLFSLT